MVRIVPVVFALTCCLPGQVWESAGYRVDLHLASSAPSIGQAVQFEGQARRGEVAAPGQTRSGELPGGVALSVTRLEDGEGYAFLVDTDTDGSLEDETEHEIRPGGKVAIDVTRMLGDRRARLVSELRFSRRGGGADVRDSFMVFPLYRAEGTLRIGERSALLALQDMDADGDFDAGDLRRGTALCIDVDGDGRIWGKHEYFAAGQVIAFAGQHLLLDPETLAPDGSTVTLRETTIPLAEAGRPVPDLAFGTTDGQEHRLAIRGKLHVLDFWASWCTPCVGTIPAVQDLERRYGGDVIVTWFSTDRQSGVEKARGVAERLGLPDARLVLDGRGDQHPVWQAFGSGQDVRMSVPTYALIDREGVVRYIGRGGENLRELHGAIDRAR